MKAPQSPRAWTTLGLVAALAALPACNSGSSTVPSGAGGGGSATVTGLTVFSRTNPQGGEDLYVVETTGDDAPVQITDNDAAPLVWVGDRVHGQEVLYAVGTAPTEFFAAAVDGSSRRRLYTADGMTVGDRRVLDGRYLVVQVTAVTGDSVGLVSVDFGEDPAEVRLLADHPGATLTWDARRTSSGFMVYVVGTALPATPSGQAYATLPDGSVRTPIALTHEPSGTMLQVRPTLAAVSGDTAIFSTDFLTSGFAESGHGAVEPDEDFRDLIRTDGFLGPLVVIGDRIVFTKADATGVGGALAPVSLCSAPLDGSRSTELSQTVDRDVSWAGTMAGDRVVYVESLPPASSAGAGAPDIRSVPADGSASPTVLSSNNGQSPVAFEFDPERLVVVGDFVVFERQSVTGALFAAEVGVTRSEQRLALPDPAAIEIVQTEPLPGGGVSNLRVIVRTLSAGFTDFWSVTPENGELVLRQLSDQSSVPDGASPPTILGPVAKRDRLLYTRGNDIYSVDPATAFSETAITSLASPPGLIAWDPASPDLHVAFTANELMVAAIDGSTPAIALTQFTGTAAVTAIHEVGPSDRVLFSADGGVGRAIYAANAAEENSAINLSDPTGAQDRFRFSN